MDQLSPAVEARILYERQRERAAQEVQRKKDEILKDTQVRIGNDKFVSQNDSEENELKRQTVGLVKLEDFLRIRDNIQSKQPGKSDKTEKKRKKKPESRVKLDFDDEKEEEEQEFVLVKKSKKDPSVDTSFLPDKEREEQEKLERQRLKKQWEQEQERIKNETVTIVYSFWDGTGHRHTIECKKGDSISTFLEKCRQQLPELRNVSVSHLMYVKEDLILPHHYTFYDFIVNKTRGKSGPLFSFDVYDDIRLVNDATKETEESHAGKVVEQSWYDKNKHIFPASRWEIFDPNVDYGKYTIKDKM